MNGNAHMSGFHRVSPGGKQPLRMSDRPHARNGPFNTHSVIEIWLGLSLARQTALQRSERSFTEMQRFLAVVKPWTCF